MSKSPAMKLSEGYTQFWPLHQSQMDRISTVEHIHLDHFIKHIAEDWPARASRGEKEGDLDNFIRAHFRRENSDTQHDINYDNNQSKIDWLQ